MSSQDLEHIVKELRGGRPRARKRALSRLRAFGDDPRAVEVLVDILRGSDEALRPDAARLLGEVKSRHGVDPLIEVLGNAARESNEDVPPQAAWALGEIGDQRAVPALRGLLADRHDDEFLFMAYREALYALADLGDPAPIEQFVGDESRDATLRDEARSHILPRAREGTGQGD